MNEQTFGRKAVGLSFNPSSSNEVDSIKLKVAELIDELHTKREYTTNDEVNRMLSIAITELQSAQMWAVKAVTWK